MEESAAKELKEDDISCQRGGVPWNPWIPPRSAYDMSCILGILLVFNIGF